VQKPYVPRLLVQVLLTLLLELLVFLGGDLGSLGTDRVVLGGSSTTLVSLEAKDTTNISVEVGGSLNVSIVTQGLATVRSESANLSSLVTCFNVLDLPNLGIGQISITQRVLLFLSDLCHVNPDSSKDLSTAAHVALGEWGVTRLDEIRHFAVEWETKGVAKTSGGLIPSEVGLSLFFIIGARNVRASGEDVLFILFLGVEAFVNRTWVRGWLIRWVFVDSEVQVGWTVRLPYAGVGDVTGRDIRQLVKIHFASNGASATIPSKLDKILRVFGLW
jgi:hypothetical protein